MIWKLSTLSHDSFYRFYLGLNIFLHHAELYVTVFFIQLPSTFVWSLNTEAVCLFTRCLITSYFWQSHVYVRAKFGWISQSVSKIQQKSFQKKPAGCLGSHICGRPTFVQMPKRLNIVYKIEFLTSVTLNTFAELHEFKISFWESTTDIKKQPINEHEWVITIPPWWMLLMHYEHYSPTCM